MRTLGVVFSLLLAALPVVGGLLFFHLLGRALM